MSARFSAAKTTGMPLQRGHRERIRPEVRQIRKWRQSRLLLVAAPRCQEGHNFSRSRANELGRCMDRWIVQAEHQMNQHAVTTLHKALQQDEVVDRSCEGVLQMVPCADQRGRFKAARCQQRQHPVACFGLPKSGPAPPTQRQHRISTSGASHPT